MVVVPALRRLAALAGAGTNVRSPYHTTVHALTSVLATIHQVAPHARVYIAGYPPLFQPGTNQNCHIGTANQKLNMYITAADARALDTASRTLDATIALAAADAGNWASYVDVTSRFAGHGLCSADPWINPITATLPIDAAGHATAVTIDSGSVHPTPTGQALGYRDSFLAAGLRA